MKNASFFGSSFRTLRSQPAAMSSASSQVISSNCPDPRGPTRGTLRVVRGGSWTAAPLTGARLDLRYARRPGEEGERDVGVRVALSP